MVGLESEWVVEDGRLKWTGWASVGSLLLRMDGFKVKYGCSFEFGGYS